MKRIGKRILTFILAVVLVVAFIPSMVFAEGDDGSAVSDNVYENASLEVHYEVSVDTWNMMPEDSSWTSGAVQYFLHLEDGTILDGEAYPSNVYVLTEEGEESPVWIEQDGMDWSIHAEALGQADLVFEYEPTEDWVSAEELKRTVRINVVDEELGIELKYVDMDDYILYDGASEVYAHVTRTFADKEEVAEYPDSIQDVKLQWHLSSPDLSDEELDEYFKIVTFEDDPCRASVQSTGKVLPDSNQNEIRVICEVYDYDSEQGS